METLILSLMTYIATVSGSFQSELGYDTHLDVTNVRHMPTVKFVSEDRLYIMKNNRIPDGSEVVGTQALYFFGGRIYLPDTWDKNSLADQAKLLHELVHFMQDSNGHFHECNGDRERLAYYIQERWIAEKLNLAPFHTEVYNTMGISPLLMVAVMYCPSPHLAVPGEGGY